MLPYIQQAVRFITESPGINDFQIIPLINISAVEAARMLDEMFNGPRPVPGQSGAAAVRAVAAVVVVGRQTGRRVRATCPAWASGWECWAAGAVPRGPDSRGGRCPE